jgi:hypothetical protein
MDQFQDFQKYMKGVNPYGMKSGIVLIDPPDEWYAAPFLPPVLQTAAHADSWSRATGKLRASH